jgi:hypothetical protein
MPVILPRIAAAGGNFSRETERKELFFGLNRPSYAETALRGRIEPVAQAAPDQKVAPAFTM